MNAKIAEYQKNAEFNLAIYNRLADFIDMFDSLPGISTWSKTISFTTYSNKADYEALLEIPGLYTNADEIQAMEKFELARIDIDGKIYEVVWLCNASAKHPNDYLDVLTKLGKIQTVESNYTALVCN